MSARRARAIAALGLLVLAAACGRKGNPLPPLRPQPGHVTDTHLRWIDDRVELRFTIPAGNADGSTPPILDGVEIYAVALPAGAPAPTPVQVIDASHLKGRVEVRHETEKETPAAQKAAGAPKDPRPLAGDVATFIDRTGTDRRQAGTDAPVLHYVVVGVSGKSHRGQPAGPFAVPLADAPPAPQGLAIAYDEQQLTFSWQPAGPGQQFRVYGATPTGAMLDPEPPPGPLQAATAFTTPVVFDTPVCLTVRAVQVSGPVVIEGPAATPQCKIPVDTFPPPVPTDLLVFPGGDGTVDVSWDAVTARDLAGYVVLRGDGGGDKLLPLMTKVITDLHYTDRTVTRGNVYTYAVRAEDVKGNASGPSNRGQVTVRIP